MARLTDHGVYSLLDYGGGPDKSATENDTAIYNMVTAATTATYPGICLFPATSSTAPIKISAAISLPASAHGLVLLGMGRYRTFIEQQTNNTPIFKSLSNLIHTLQIEGMHLGWASQQTTSHTDSYGVQYTRTDSSPNDGSHYHWILRDLWIDKAYTAIGIKGAVRIPVWNNRFGNIIITDPAQDGINLVNPTGEGQPNNVMTDIYISGLNSTPAGHAIIADACELSIQGLDIEDWSNGVLKFTNAGVFNILDGLHLERTALNEDAVPIIEVNNCHLSLRGLKITTVTVDQAGVASVFKIGAGGTLYQEIFEGSSITLTSGTLAFLSAASAESVYVRGFKDDVTNLTPFTGSTIAICEFVSSGVPIATFAAGDTTPSVLGRKVFRTNNGEATTITFFDDGYHGQEITVIGGDANTTLDDTGDLKINGDLVMAVNTTIKLVFDGRRWVEIGRSANG